MMTRLQSPVAALAIYFGVSLVYFGAPMRTHFSTVAIGSGADPWQFMWLLRWWPYALIHGINPLVTKVLFAPYGFNLAWMTSIPAVAVVGAPLTLTFGPIITFNLVMLLAPALSAWSGFLLCRYLTQAFVPAMTGGYLFGFSSYEVGHLSEGHLNLVSTFLVPMAVLLCLLFYDRKLRWPKFVVLLALIVVFQFGVSMEILATATSLGMVALATAFLVNRERRRDLLSVAHRIALAYLLAGLILMPYELYLYKGLHNLPRSFYPTDWYSADLANYVIPTALTQLGGILFAPMSTRFLNHVGNPGELGAYLGVPQLLVGLLSAAAFRKSIAGKILIVSGMTAVVASLGPLLHVAGYGGHLLRLWMPWAVISQLPILRFALPDRFTLYVTLVVSIAVALWLRRASTRKWIKGTLALASVALLVPAIGAPEMHTSVEIPAFFADRTYRQYLKPGDTALVIPYGKWGQSMLWQATTGMYFRLVGGYLGDRVPPELARWRMVDLRWGKTFPGYAEVLRAFLVAHDVRFVIVSGDEQTHWRAFFSPILGAGRDIDGVTLYEVPRSVGRVVKPGLTDVGMPR